MAFAAAALWASAPTDSSGPAALKSILTTGFLLLAIAIPPVLAVLNRSSSVRRQLSALVAGFQTPRAYGVLLLCFSTAQLLRIFDVGPPNLLLSAGMLALAVLMALWLFYARSDPNLHAVILTGAWGIALVLARQIVQLFLENVDFLQASWPMRLFGTYHFAILLILAASPVLVLSQRLRTGAHDLLHRTAPASAGPFAPILLLTSLCLIGLQVTGAEAIRLVFLTRACLLALTLVAGWLAGGIPSLGAVAIPDIPKGRFVLALCAVCFGYLALALSFQSDYINPDGLSYLTIARSYAEGQPVVRGYWSPLISWLLAPAVALGIDPYAAFRGLQQVVGLAFILLSTMLGRRAGLSRTSRLAVAAAMALVILTRDFYIVTPDLLGALVVGLYFYVLTHPSFTVHPIRFGILAGLTGALAYYAKYYNFAFFLLHFPFSCFLLGVHGRKIRSVAQAAGSGLGSFFVACLPWILALSARYGHPTITTSSAINIAITGPNATGHSCWTAQLCDQPEDVLFPGEDPQPQYYRGFGWSPFDSWRSLRHEIGFVWNNLTNWVEQPTLQLGRFPAVVILALGICVLVLWPDVERRLRTGWAFLTLVLYAAGYMLMFPYFRYYLSIIPLLWIATYGLLQGIPYRMPDYGPRPKRSVAMLTGLMLVVAPIMSFSWYGGLAYSLQYRADPCLRRDAEALASQLVPPTAGTDPVIHPIAYYTRVRTYGAFPAETSPSDADLILRQMNVRTLFTASSSELARVLPDHGYHLISLVHVCGTEYSVLRVPGD